MVAESEAAFAYHEPSIITVLSYTGFLLTLNIANSCLDKLLYCGLIGQLFIGILWGTPGAQWFGQETERVIQQIGYLGLILLIYEGKGTLFSTQMCLLIMTRWFVNLNQILESKHPPFHSRRHHWSLCPNGLVVHSQGTCVSDISSILRCRCSLKRNQSWHHIYHSLDHAVDNYEARHSHH